jgi:3-hydroxyacyl-[acyl-carrier-protein] dehydratase
MTSLEHSVTFGLPADHPALAGHFPDAPVAPGVLLLDLIVCAAEDWFAKPLPVRRIGQVKFHAPLLPGAQATAHLRLEGTRLRFRLEAPGAGALIAEGSLALAAGSDA